MKNNTFDGDLQKTGIIGSAGATTIKRSQMAQVHKPHATTVIGEGYAHLTAGEVAFAEALVDHMVRVAAGARDDARIGPVFYIDSTLAGNWGNGDHPHALDRIGMTAADLYCRRAFGQPLDRIIGSKRMGVLGLLDSIKLVFQDGSDAGVFFAIVHQEMLEPRSSMPGAQVRLRWQRTARAFGIA